MNPFNLFKKSKKEPESLKEILNYLKRLDENFQNLSKEFKECREKSKNFFQKIGVKRFNPFNNIGSDQSFVIALLDGQNNGFVVSSLYSLEGTKIFAKPLKEGKSEYPLSDEEKEAIEKALNQKP